MLNEGTKVTAKVRITEGGQGCDGDPEVDDIGDVNFIHAEPGDVGTVESIEDGDPAPVYYVTFERKGTGCIVGEREIAPLLN